MTTPTPLTTAAHNTPLDDLTLDTVTQELAALEANPVNGWNVIYPTLHDTLQGIIQELCTALNCTAPAMIITFLGVQRHQASAHLLTDGSTQLHIGVEFIRATLLNRNAQNHEARYRAFKWTIAHELSHLCDPAFNRYGRAYQIRLILDKVASTCLFLSLVSFMPGASVFLGTTTNYTAILIASATFMVLNTLFVAVLHRRFEYFADAMAARLVDDSDQQAITLALTTMTTAIRNSITNPYAQASSSLLRLYGWCYQKSTLTKLFFLHPSIEKRLKRLQQSQAPW